MSLVLYIDDKRDVFPQNVGVVAALVEADGQEIRVVKVLELFDAIHDQLALGGVDHVPVVRVDDAEDDLLLVFSIAEDQHALRAEGVRWEQLVHQQGIHKVDIVAIGEGQVVVRRRGRRRLVLFDFIGLGDLQVEQGKLHLGTVRPFVNRLRGRELVSLLFIERHELVLASGASSSNNEVNMGA